MWFRRRRQADCLRTCPVCGGHLPCPINWEPSGDEHWRIAMRCGDCDSRYELTITNERAKRLDHELDVDLQAIRRVLNTLDRERMADEIEQFVTALDQGLIDAGDFSPR
jgi:hypothetical protein